LEGIAQRWVSLQNITWLRQRLDGGQSQQKIIFEKVFSLFEVVAGLQGSSRPPISEWIGIYKTETNYPYDSVQV
jgi:hypothetical protein